MGRPSKKDTINLDQLYKLALLGATDEQIADFFNISRATLSNYKAQDKTFLDTLKKGKIMADAEVAESLRHRALGYSHQETKFVVVNGDVQQFEVTKHYPPDTAAAIFWLKNRQRDRWKDKWDEAPQGPQYDPPTTIENAPTCATDGCSGFAVSGDGLCEDCREVEKPGQ